MKVYSWNTEKNEKLKAERGITFEKVMLYIENGWLLDIINHPNHKEYLEQKIFIVNIDDYAYLVPFVESENEIFLKTVIPSRKMTKKYIHREV
ncbi:PF04365 family protein [Candidatus Scalindua japonica]|uniref:PF04365 family protein n=1 Tax=Candidatus Scalindua japonica TaxID=1284222 RepID=A0A286TX65_9BACT|nr:BrnT family toxin [Candidatus Scalindua japonica]GAX60479.1 PF04365 family protein [Candidatus Scalindua japonica]